MLNQRHKILTVPVELSQFVYNNELTKPFSIFLYLKLNKGDKFSEQNLDLNKLGQDLKMSDPKKRTFRKHFEKLLEINWIGYNPKSGIYHIRSFDYLRAIYGLKKRWGTNLVLKDIKQLQVYLAGVIISNLIQKQKYYCERVKRKLKTAIKKNGVANQSKAFFSPSHLNYFGLSNHTIAKALGCGYTRASQLKSAAVEAGYIKVTHKYADYTDLNLPDFSLRPTINSYDTPLASRLSFRPRQNKDKKTVIRVIKQLHDEIAPLFSYRKIVRFNKLCVPYSILQQFII